MLELSNPSALYLGIVDHVSSMTSGALVCLLVWVGVKVKRNSGALRSFWVQLWFWGYCCMPM